MDTPGHVDFAYEVSRSLAACEGSLLVVDASQGVEAQTLANVYQAIDAGHEIVPVLNKIDLPAAEPERVKQQIEEVIGLDASGAVEISAKTGLNIEEVLEALVTRLPPPKGDAAAPLKALLVDSWYDSYLGVVILVRVKDGVLKPGMQDPHDGDRRRASGRARRRLHAQGDAGRRSSGPARSASSPPASRRWPIARSATPSPRSAAPPPTPLPGFKPVQPVVFCGLFPTDAADYEQLRDSLAKLRLNDASFEYEPETSAALGLRLPLRLSRPAASRDHPGAAGARVRSRPHRHRALGRLSRPSHQRRDAARCTIPVDMPDPVRIDHIEEPWIKATILVPDEYLGGDAGAVRGAARRAEGPDLCRQPRHGGLSPAAQRGGVRFLRPAQIGEPRLCQLRLSDRRLRRRATSC